MAKSHRLDWKPARFPYHPFMTADYQGEAISYRARVCYIESCWRASATIRAEHLKRDEVPEQSERFWNVHYRAPGEFTFGASATCLRHGALIAEELISRIVRR